MKKRVKILTTLLALVLLMSTSTPSAFAEGTVYDECKTNDYVEAITVPTQDPVSGATQTLTVQTTAEALMEKILSSDAFSIEGSVTTNTGVKDVNAYYDFDSMSRFAIADWAERNALITQEQKMESYCDLVMARQFDNITCLEPVVSAIQEYQVQNPNDSQMMQKTTLALNSLDPMQEEQASTRSFGEIDEENWEIRSFTAPHFLIYYKVYIGEKSTIKRLTPGDASDVADYLLQVRQYFIDLGFDTPLLESGTQRYRIYLDPEYKPGTSGLSGLTTGTGDYATQSTCASYITIFGFTGISQIGLTHVLAHEYFHAIQNAYNYDSSWFKESCATWAGAVAYGYLISENNVSDIGSMAKPKINSFIQSQNSLFDQQTSNYGAAVFICTLDVYFGGSSTILEIYEVYNTYSSTDLSWLQLKTVLNTALSNQGYTEDGVLSVFKKMAIQIVDPLQFYGAFLYSYSPWAQPNYTTKALTTEVYSYGTGENTLSVLPLARQYYKFTVNTSLENYRVRINVGCSNNSGGASFLVKTTSGRRLVTHVACDNSNNVSYSYVNDTNDAIVEVYVVVYSLDDTDDTASTSYTLSAFVEDSHNHNYTVRYSQLNSLKHLAYCSCGQSLAQRHTYMVDFVTGESVCSLCGYVEGSSNIVSIEEIECTH